MQQRLLLLLLGSLFVQWLGLLKQVMQSGAEDSKLLGGEAADCLWLYSEQLLQLQLLLLQLLPLLL